VHTGEPAPDQVLVMSPAPDDPKVLYAAGYHRLLESADGGITWSAMKSQPPGNQTFALLPLSKNRILAGTDQGLFVSSDDGTWKQSYNRRVIAVNRTGGPMLSALTADGALASADRGETWRKCGDPPHTTAWYGLAFDAGSSDVALAATPAGLFRSTDGCRSWTTVASGLRMETASLVLFHPTRPGEAYAALGGKVFCSTDGGRQWSPLDEEAPGNSGPSSLFVLPTAPDRLFALFPRRGVFSTSIKEKTLQ